MAETEIKQNIERRYQVFISSTFKDLEIQRKSAIQVIVERKHIPISLERFSARQANDLDVIKKAIADCQIYLLILGHRYGELVPPGNEISYTELEYNLALENRLEILVLQMHPDDVRKAREKLNRSIDDEKREIENEARYNNFLARLKRHHRQFWKVENQDFKYEVAIALNDNLPNCSKRGFIPEPEDPTFVETAANEFIVDLVTELRGFETLYKRVSQEEPKKRALAKFFRQIYANAIVHNRIHVFFESGSTIAYVAKDLASSLSNVVHIDDDGAPTMKISTNNVLAYLLLWLKMRIPCSPFPWSTPSEKKFGAWYGGLEQKEALNPDYSGAGLNGEARREIQSLLRHNYRPGKDDEPALLLGAASGLQIGKEHKLKFREGLDTETEKDLTEQLSRCFGPHVGSYHNKIFKRFMYDTKVPIIIFLSADKIDRVIEVGKCHFILDQEFSWNQFCTAHPLAFCIGCSQSERRKTIRAFQDLGFATIDANTGEEVTAFIARNQAFVEQFEKKYQVSTPAAAFQEGA